MQFLEARTVAVLPILGNQNDFSVMTESLDAPADSGVKRDQIVDFLIFIIPG
jgi:hypothetical protein